MANVVKKHSISSELAQKMVDAAVAKAREIGVSENVAILDDGGNLKAFSRMDGAPMSDPIEARRAWMAKSSRARYTLEFKLEAVRMVKGGQSLAAVSKILGIADQTLHNWIKAEREGRLGGADSRPVSAEQMEIARLRAELARVKMERDILEKATAYFAKERG